MREGRHDALRDALAAALPGRREGQSSPANADLSLLTCSARQRLFRLLFLGICERRSLPPPPDLAAPDAPRPLRDAVAILAAGRDDLDELYQAALGYHFCPDAGGRPALSADLSRRKTTGSYYTPACLIECLLRSALDPTLGPPWPRVCDPACGSGRFLVAAGRRLAGRSPDRDTRRDVFTRCLHGVDRDPLAVELCRFRLWLECGDPALPLAAFEKQVRVGDSLLQTHPEEGRFDVVLCNPPWERVKFQEREWLAARHLGLSSSGEAERKRCFEMSLFLRESGRFPLGARGDLNYYGPFVEACRRLVRKGGRVGMIVPSGLATDDSMKALFRSLMETDLLGWYGFHNCGRLFPGVQGNVTFGLLTLGPRQGADFRAAAGLSHPDDLDRAGAVYPMSAERVRRVNPNTLHAAAFTSAGDAALVECLHARHPVLEREPAPRESPWGIRPGTMFHMTRDAPCFRTLEQLHAAGYRREGNAFHSAGGEHLLPLYEAKLVRPFQHRAATFEGVAGEVRFRTHARTRPLTEAELRDGTPVTPRYWVPASLVRARSAGALWLLGFRNAISTRADSRSLTAAVLPVCGVGNSLPLIGGLDARRACLLLALLNSFVVDHVLRQKASGSNLNFHVLRQLPVPAPGSLDRPCPWDAGRNLADWLVERVLELTFTSDDLSCFARECGHAGGPFVWDEGRRCGLRAEIDAACFRLYGLSRGEAEHVLDSFPVLERKERRRWGSYRSREAVLAAFDRLI
jgi:hypothetical protein